MAAQLTRIEMVALFSLAAAIGVPLQAPDRGLLAAVVIAVIVVGVGRAVASRVFFSRRFEARIEDPLAGVGNDGVFDMKKIKGVSMTTERLKAALRSHSIRHLGEVKRLYFQSNGSFALVKKEQPQPGLSLLPLYDKEFIDGQKKSDEKWATTAATIKRTTLCRPVQIAAKRNGWLLLFEETGRNV